MSGRRAAARLLLWLALPAGALSAAASARALGRRPRRPAPAAAPPGPDSLDAALAALAEVEQAAQAGADPVDCHYARVAEVLRAYLEEAAGVPARRRTSAETLALLPAPFAAEGRGLECAAVLAEADLVKFAGRRPSAAAAAAHVARARALLLVWGGREGSPAVR